MTQRFKVLIFSHIPKFRYFIDLLHANILLLIMLQHVYIERYHGSKITKSRNFSSCHWNVNSLAAHNMQKCLKQRHRIPFTIMILYVYQKHISISQYNYRWRELEVRWLWYDQRWSFQVIQKKEVSASVVRKHYVFVV